MADNVRSLADFKKKKREEATKKNISVAQKIGAALRKFGSFTGQTRKPDKKDEDRKK